MALDGYRVRVSLVVLISGGSGVLFSGGMRHAVRSSWSLGASGMVDAEGPAWPAAIDDRAGLTMVRN